MKKSQQGAAVAVVAIGLIVLAVGAIVLISQLLEERAARQRLEQEAAELRQEIEGLKAGRMRSLRETAYPPSSTPISPPGFPR